MTKTEHEELEEWRPIFGWKHYQVSSLGRVRSLDKEVPAKNGGTAVKRGRILKPANHRGYLAVRLRDSGSELTIKVHKLVLVAFVGFRPTGLEARHVNGNELDNRASNLIWGTRSENNLDRVLHGTHQNSIKTHCPQNHPYNEGNTYTTPAGGRKCRICKRNQFLAFKERQANNV